MLREINGQPLLDYLLQRLERCRQLDGIILATSVEPSDDALEAYAARRRVGCIRGPLDDVAARFRLVLQATGASAFARVSGDSPLLDPALIDRAVSLFDDGDWHLVTNVQTRTFPKGQSVEILDAATFAEVSESYTTAPDREHVTPFYYANAERFRIRNFESDRELGEMRMVIDTQADLDSFQAIVKHMDRPHWEYGVDDLVPLYEALAP